MGKMEEDREGGRGKKGGVIRMEGGRDRRKSERIEEKEDGLNEREREREIDR